MKHKTAKPSHYNQEAEHYDQFNEENSKIINQTIENILRKHKVKTVLDLTCGTGSQVFWLTKRGYQVVGSDISSQMLTIGKAKAQHEKLDIQFTEGDMRTVKIGKFDTVITIFNAVGHLTKSDFEKAMRNIHSNLNDGGLYIFDINNLDYLLRGNNITSLTIDWQTINDNKKARVIQYSTIDTDGILASYTTLHEQKHAENPKISRSAQTLQVYSAQQLKEMLEKNGFQVVEQLAINGTEFVPSKSDRILTVAQKK